MPCGKALNWVTISSMNDQRGEINPLLIPLLFASIFFAGALGFGIWAYSERSNYKNNTDQIVEKEVSVAVERAQTEKDNEFLEKEKQPFKTYQGSEVLGSFSVQYPKTWSVYSNDTSGQASVLFHPNFVPANNKTAYAMKVEVLDRPYDSVASTFANDVKTGKLRAIPYALPKVPNSVGLRLDGELKDKKRGTVVILPLRDKTIQITSESETFTRDLNETILPNFTFIP